MRKLIAITALTAFAVMAFAGPAFAAKGNTKVLWDSEDAVWGNDNTTIFEGYITGKKSCRTSRRITVYQVMPGADKKMGSEKTTPVFVPGWSHVDFQISRDGHLTQPSYRYYAKTPATKKCKGARSVIVPGNDRDHNPEG